MFLTHQEIRQRSDVSDYVNVLRAKLAPLPPRADEWMSTAVDCLEFLPDELVVEVSRGLSGCADDLVRCKRLMYEVLAQHYGHAQRPPLLSNHVFDIHSGISELLGTARSTSGVERRRFLKLNIFFSHQ